jgi:archaetidylinositol phosphate synthase
MVLGRFREHFRGLLESLAQGLMRSGLTANGVTALALLLSILSAALLWRYAESKLFLVAATALFALSSAMDAMDGTIARLSQEKSALGAFLDSYSDRIAEIAVLSALMLGGYAGVLTGLLFLTTSLLISYARARAEALGVDMAGVGFMERAERILLLLVGMLVWAVDGRLLDAFLLVGCALNVATIVQRVNHVWHKAGRTT